MKNPIKKVIVGYIAQKALRRVLPKAIPGGIAAILVAEGVKYLLEKKKSGPPSPQATPKATKSTRGRRK